MIKHFAWPYVISKFEEHKIVKERLLYLIENDIGQAVDLDNLDKISKTDWYNNKNIPKNYWSFLFPYIEKHNREVFDALEHDQPEYLQNWFQQYKSNDKHRWHQHRNCTWAGVYYVELGKDCPRTMFKDPFTKEIIVPELEEGDILTFPGLLWHCSPENQSDERKTIVAYNVY